MRGLEVAGLRAAEAAKVDFVASCLEHLDSRRVMGMGTVEAQAAVEMACLARVQELIHHVLDQVLQCMTVAVPVVVLFSASRLMRLRRYSTLSDRTPG
jgi:hypothetical protein